MKADRGHIHHRLLALGLNQKQAVAVLYAVSAIFGLAAVLLAAAAALAVWLWVVLVRRRRKQRENQKDG